MPSYVGEITEASNRAAGFLVTIRDQGGKFIAAFSACSRKEADEMQIEMLKIFEGRKFGTGEDKSSSSTPKIKRTL